MAKVFVVNGVRCVPETAKFDAKAIMADAIAKATEKAEMTKLVLSFKANEILASI